GRARVDDLREGLGEAVEEDEELDVAAEEIVIRLAPQRTLLVDRMDDGPRRREEDDAVALELERDVLPLHQAVALPPRHQDLRLDLDDLVRLHVDDAEHEGGPVAVRRDDGAAAEDDLRHRAGEAREDDAGD